MIALMAPAHLPQTVITLPNPEFLDEIALQGDVEVKFTMSGEMVSYTRSTNKRLLTVQILLRQENARELDEFIRAYYGERWRWIYKDQTYYGHIQETVPTFTAISRTMYSVDLNFEGVLQP